MITNKAVCNDNNPLTAKGARYLSEFPDAVTARGITLEKSEVIMGEGPIRYTGEHTVLIHLHADVETEIKVTINPE